MLTDAQLFWLYSLIKWIDQRCESPTGHEHEGTLPRTGRNSIVLTGPMAVGKTTVGAIVATTLGWDLIDSDDHIEALTGMTGGEFAAQEGVPALHRLEAKFVEEAIGSHRTVIAAAASIADSNQVIRLLQEAEVGVVLLEARPQLLVDRMTRATHRRDVNLDELRELTEIRRSRLDVLQNCYLIRVDDLEPETVAAWIVECVVQAANETGEPDE